MLQYDTSGQGATYRVTGVLEGEPRPAHFTFNMLVSFSTFFAARPQYLTADGWGDNSYYTYLLLQPGTGPKALEAKLPAFHKKHINPIMQRYNSSSRFEFSLQPLTDIYLHSNLRYEIGQNGNATNLLVLLTVGLLILVVAGINYVNLTTAASTQRAREVGIQKVLGAGRHQLTGQHLGESAIVTFGALLIGLALVSPLLPFFNNLFDRQLTAQPLLHPAALAGMACFGLVVSLLAGFYPALVVSKFQPVKVLKGHFKFTSSGVWLRKSLVVFQFGISILLIICTMVLQQQMHFIPNKKLGFDKDQVVALPADRQINQSYDALKSQFLQNANIRSVSISYDSPVHIKGGYSIGKSANESDSRPVRAQPAGLDFLKTAGIGLAAGSDFSPADMEAAERLESDTTVQISILLNESLAKVYGWTPEEAVNQYLVFNGKRSQVKGVVNDFHFTSLHEPIAPLVIFPSPWGRVVLVKLTWQDIEATLSYMGKEWQTLVPHRPFSYHFLDEEFAQMYTAEIQTSRVVTTFTWLAILLACLGLFGLASYSFVQRTKEIGIRKVLGATTYGIVGLLSKDFLKLVLVSLVIASPLAWYFMDRWLTDFAYRVNIGWWVFALAGGLAVTVAFLTISIQSVKAALGNPVNALRSE